MVVAEIFFTILLNVIPLIMLIVPYIFIRNKTIGKLYFRIVLGIIVFYMIYWILPIIFQIGVAPKKLSVSGEDEGNITLGIGFIIAHFGSLIASFAFYPLVTLPFIFFVAPFVSLLFLWNHLRKQEGTVRENLMLLTYEFSESPLQMIRGALLRGDWSREKEILKLMIVLLPISLYLLQVILDLSNLQNVSLTEGKTSLGWFLEILFVYLAVFIFSIELLFSSQIALKGRYFGESLRKQTYKSLYQIGAPISILSIILFVLQYTASIFIIIYFFAYFIMASIIFILFLKVFEPISILIFFKLIDWWKNKGKVKKIEKVKKIRKSNFYPLILGFIAVFIFFTLNLLLFGPIYRSIFGTQGRKIIQSAKFTNSNPTFYDAFGFDILIIFNFIVLFLVPIVIMSALLAYSLKFVKKIFVGFLLFLPVIIVFSILFLLLGTNPLMNFAPEEYWLTGQSSYITIFGFKFYTFRTATFEADLTVEGGISLLLVLAMPYLYLRYIFNVIIWALMIFYLRKEFKIKNIPIDEKRVEKTIFSSIPDFLPYNDYFEGKIRCLISKNKGVIVKDPEQEREEVINLLKILEKDKLLNEIKPKNEEEIKKLYYILKYLFNSNQISIWKPEFSFVYEKVEKQGLYIIHSDGRDVFDYTFVKEHLHDPSLIAGMFTAITSFIKETTKSAELLKTIDHGDVTILIEYGKDIFGALFIKGSQTSEIRAQFREFISQFESKHMDVLPGWDGALNPFKEDHLLVEEIFKEE